MQNASNEIHRQDLWLIYLITTCPMNPWVTYYADIAISGQHILFLLSLQNEYKKTAMICCCNDAGGEVCVYLIVLTVVFKSRVCAWWLGWGYISFLLWHFRCFGMTLVNIKEWFKFTVTLLFFVYCYFYIAGICFRITFIVQSSVLVSFFLLFSFILSYFKTR